MVVALGVRPDDLAKSHVARLPLSAGSVTAKRAAVDAHESQVRAALGRAR